MHKGKKSIETYICNRDGVSISGQAATSRPISLTSGDNRTLQKLL